MISLKKTFMNKSIGEKLIIYFLGIILTLTLTITYFGNLAYRESINKSQNENTNQIIKQISNNIDFYVEKSENIINYMSTDPRILKFLNDNEKENHNIEDEAYKSIYRFTKFNSEIAGIMVVNMNGGYISDVMNKVSRDSLTNEEWYKTSIEDPENIHIYTKPIGRNINNIFKYSADEVFSMSKAVIDYETKEIIGVILIDIKLDVIKDVIENSKPGIAGFVFIVDKDSEIVYTPVNDIVYRIKEEWIKDISNEIITKKIKGENYQLTKNTSQYTGWETVGVFPEKESLKVIKSITMISFAIGGIALIFSTILAIVFTNSIANPIYKLKSLMRQAQNGDLDVYFNRKYNDEIGDLGDSFNSMVKEIKNLLRLIKIEETKKRKAEMNVLQAQIKPHFMYNTLDTIRWMAEEKEENDIVEIISEDIRLKKSGRNYIGLCPFHNDKSPSFTVSQDKQIYKCFSCGEAGNVLTFIMKYKKLNFLEAAKYLADKASITLNMGSKENSAVSKKKQLMYKINVDSARYFFANLQKNKYSKDYFLNRGIKEETIKRFGLGYSLDNWHALMNYLKKRGYKEEILLEAGLILRSEKKGNLYDRFRNRVMFPVFDVKGNVIGFGGRVLDDSKPKYLNSPETIIFQKGINLYGLNFAIKNNLKEDFIIIVEGYMDLIALHQAGITNVVASLGTALTVNQARLLKRYVSKVIISYDADVAGQTATLRGLEILKNAGFEIKVLTVPQGKDPDEFVRNNGKEAFLRLIDEALPLIEYRIKKASQGVNFKDGNELITFGEKFAEILASVNPIEKDVYIKKISEETSIKEQALYDLLSQVMSKNQKENDFLNKKGYFGTKLYVEPAYLKAERALLKLMIDYEFYDEIVDNLDENNFILDSHNKIYSLIIEAKKNNTNNISSYIESRCDDIESSKEYTKIKEENILNLGNSDKQIKDYIEQIKSFKLKIQIDDLKKKQSELEKKGNIEESIEIAMELIRLSKQLKVK